MADVGDGDVGSQGGFHFWVPVARLAVADDDSVVYPAIASIAIVNVETRSALHVTSLNWPTNLDNAGKNAADAMGERLLAALKEMEARENAERHLIGVHHQQLNGSLKTLDDQIKSSMDAVQRQLADMAAILQQQADRSVAVTEAQQQRSLTPKSSG
jgi:hypothetical protein